MPCNWARPIRDLALPRTDDRHVPSEEKGGAAFARHAVLKEVILMKSEAIRVFHAIIVG